jgi:hypothetical protein
MVSIEIFRQMALSLPGTVEQPHFEKTSFRVNKKIFATLAGEKSIAMLTLSLIDQSVFCAFGKTIIYPVPGAWGTKGCTYFDLKKIKKAMLKDALACAYQNIIAKKK